MKQYKNFQNTYEDLYRVLISSKVLVREAISKATQDDSKILLTHIMDFRYDVPKALASIQFAGGWNKKNLLRILEEEKCTITYNTLLFLIGIGNAIVEANR